MASKTINEMTFGDAMDRIRREGSLRVMAEMVVDIYDLQQQQQKIIEGLAFSGDTIVEPKGKKQKTA